MRAILSDVHGNLDALQAVLAETSRQRMAAVYNLGDTTGHGPNPIGREKGTRLVSLQ
jgi:predicted phosphodiesterase